MISIKKILVPVDFSEPSMQAVNYGLSLALQFNAHLVLAHIVPSSTALIYTFPTQSFGFEKDQVNYARSVLPTLVPEKSRDRVALQTIVRTGEVRSDLLEIVNNEKIDLVVMGTHGRNAFERFLLGSLTGRMLRKFNVPVLTVSHLDPSKELHSTDPVPLRHVLYATDLSDSAEIGLRFSIELARGTGARLTVLHVFDDLQTVHWDAEGGGYYPEALQGLRDDALARLRNSIPEELCSDVLVTPVMVEGEAFREILRFAEEDKADLIVMNLQGKSRIESALLGSTAERVIRAAHIPVLSIPVTVEQRMRAA